MKRHTVRLILALAVLLGISTQQAVLAAPPVQTTAATTTLPSSSWVLSSLNGSLPLPGSTITLEIDKAGTLSGSDGCNRYSVPFTAKGSEVSIGAAGGDTGPAVGISTMMACAPAVSAQADAYMAALNSASRFQLVGDMLVLFDGTTVVATFVPVSQNLAGTSWQVIAYNNGREAVVSVLEGVEINAVFDDDNRVSGNAGCNDYFATYLTSDGSILISSIGSTMRFCSNPDGVMDQEAEYLAALQSAATYAIEGNNLEMRTASGALAIQATRILNIVIPEPEPGVPTGIATAPNGVNVRTGPGTNFPVIGVAPYGAEGEIIGRSADSRWWVVSVPSAAGGMGWVSADFVAVSNVEDVPIIASPAPPVIIVPTATPQPTATPRPAATATPAPRMSFSANPTTIQQGQCSTLTWNVENVQAVWVYPQGQPYQNFPRTGQGSEQVCPPTTTTYEMRVLLRTGAVEIQRVTVNVTPAAPTNPLNGTAWQVTGFNNGNNAVVSPIGGTTLTARFDASNVSGQGGCNDFSTSYSVSGSNIWIGMPAQGMMMCDQPVMDQEQQYLAALQSATTFQFDGNRLTLRRWDGATAVTFSRLQ